MECIESGCRGVCETELQKNCKRGSGLEVVFLRRLHDERHALLQEHLQNLSNINVVIST